MDTVDALPRDVYCLTWDELAAVDDGWERMKSEDRSLVQLAL